LLVRNEYVKIVASLPYVPHLSSLTLFALNS
jgi:hypothetical protein